MKKVPKDIYINNAYLKKNRRDGISIISVNGLVLENVYAGYQDGTKPMCGINFETNNPDCEIRNVKVINPRTEFNAGSGIQVGISTLLGKGLKNVDLQMINHVDVNSGSFAFKIACNKKELNLAGGVSGLISVINPSWNGTKGNRPLAFITNQADLKLEIFNPSVKSSAGSILSDNQINAILKKHSNGKLLIEHR